MFHIEGKKKIFLLLNLNKENLSTRLSAILAPYNIKSIDFLKQFTIELNNYYGEWLNNELVDFIIDKSVIIANLEFIIPVELIVNLNGLLSFCIKLPKWGFLFSYSLIVQQKLFYLNLYKGFLLKTTIDLFLIDYDLLKNYCFLIRCGFILEKFLIY